jgi:hypothetical protein
MSASFARCALVGVLALGAPAAVQGKAPAAATPGGSLQAIARLLPGHYDNAAQSIDDERRSLPPADRHARILTTITRIVAPAFGPHAFLWVNETRGESGTRRSYRIATLEAGPAAESVTMRHYLRMAGAITTQELATLTPAALRRTEGCDYVFVPTTAGFRGAQLPRACRFEWEGQPVYTDNDISLSPAALSFVDHKFVIATGQRVTGVASGEPFRLERLR